MTADTSLDELLDDPCGDCGEAPCVCETARRSDVDEGGEA